MKPVILLLLTFLVACHGFSVNTLHRGAVTRRSLSMETPAEPEFIGAKKISQKDYTLKTVLSIEQIAKILPHRYPFLLVDRVVEFVPGKKAVGLKQVTANEPQFTGHFPDR